MRKRDKQDETAIQHFLKLLEIERIVVEPANVLDVVKDDESDNRYLECAVEEKALCVISGDKHLLDIGEYRGIVILPPAAFLAVLNREGM